MSKKTALVIITNGTEEIEAVTTADVLVRGDVDVTIAGLESADAVTCSRNVRIQPHASLASVADRAFDCVVLPGGLPGAKAFAASLPVKALLERHYAAGGIVAAICAASIALESHTILPGSTVTSHPSVRDQLKSYNYSEERVCVAADGRLVTSRGPGTAFEFALKLVELLQGREKADSLVAPMLLKI
uniref:DJ-1_PfpI domain-containing protein n=2 Tax=Macrostomum lignano TaxID=282301 RepID=A0A1I8HWJ0_9PLAT